MEDIIQIGLKALDDKFFAEVKRLDEKIALGISGEAKRLNEVSNLRADYDAKASSLLAQQVEKSALVLSGQVEIDV